MGISRPNQQLRRELKVLARQSDEAAHLIWLVAKTLPAEKLVEVMSAVVLIHDCVDRANALADQVKGGQIRAFPGNEPA